MNVKEASAELGVSVHMIYKLMRNGQLGYLQVGRRRLPLDSSVIEYRQKHTVEAHRPLHKPAPTRKTYKHLAL
jgi:excisionase family DNA binding protein